MAPLALVSSAGSESKCEVNPVDSPSSFQTEIPKWKEIVGSLWKSLGWKYFYSGKSHRDSLTPRRDGGKNKSLKKSNNKPKNPHSDKDSGKDGNNGGSGGGDNGGSGGGGNGGSGGGDNGGSETDGDGDRTSKSTSTSQTTSEEGSTASLPASSSAATVTIVSTSPPPKQSGSDSTNAIAPPTPAAAGAANGTGPSNTVGSAVDTPPAAGSISGAPSSETDGGNAELASAGIPSGISQFTSTATSPISATGGDTTSTPSQTGTDSSESSPSLSTVITPPSTQSIASGTTSTTNGEGRSEPSPTNSNGEGADPSSTTLKKAVGQAETNKNSGRLAAGIISGIVALILVTLTVLWLLRRWRRRQRRMSQIYLGSPRESSAYMSENSVSQWTAENSIEPPMMVQDTLQLDGRGYGLFSDGRLLGPRDFFNVNRPLEYTNRHSWDRISAEPAMVMAQTTDEPDLSRHVSLAVHSASEQGERGTDGSNVDVVVADIMRSMSMRKPKV